MPEWIHDLSCWLFYSEHSADWWMVVVTSVAVIAAIWAGRAAYEQLQLLKRQVETDSELSNQQLRLLGDQVLAATRSVEQAQVASEKQLAEMEAARKDSLRPVLWPKAARLVQVRGQTRLVLTIANVGPGPSIRAQADVWFYPADPEDPAGEKASLAYSKERDAPRAGLVLDHPIGTGDEAEGYVHSPTDPEIEETGALELDGLGARPDLRRHSVHKRSRNGTRVSGSAHRDTRLPVPDRVARSDVRPPARGRDGASLGSSSSLPPASAGTRQRSPAPSARRSGTNGAAAS